ncbi:hypothetical protein QR680_010145 [Steinernema hermaphroditum]|uniref:F-box domain-containing protein n=1 Tax=Steinernema hermaphroditum TaxID=289476 RepID=A0AA39IQD0_9BILA|nr:hypothetical protein QR680_010145 [Steinernema hermaphroditum]
MDLLPYDLVEHLVQFLPRKDLETITIVACERPELSNWQLMAEQHLDERYLLDIRIFVQDQNKPEGTAKHVKLEEGEEIDDKNEEIQVYVEKHRFTGELVGPWDFKKLQYASLRDVSISFHPWKVNKKHRPWEKQKLLSILSLPVATRGDSNTRSSLSVNNHYHWISTRLDSRVIDLGMEVIQVIQKTFAKLDIHTSTNGTNLRVEDSTRDYINHEAFLEDLRFSYRVIRNERFSQGIVTLFKERRSTPLTVEIPPDSLSYRNIQEILEHWKNSDGYVAGHKELHMQMSSDKWSTLQFKWKGKHDYLPHPLKRSSLLLSINCLKIVKFESWHLPVNFDWIDSVINDWKTRAGMYLYGSSRKIKLVMEREDWDKLEQKYWSSRMTEDRFQQRRHLAVIAHPSNLSSIELRKYRIGYMVMAEKKVKNLRLGALESFISEWMKRSGDFVVGQLRKVTVGLSFTVWERISNDRQAFYVHPHANSRLKIQASRDCDLYTMSVVSIDPETVKDWNLELLFGAE